MNLRDTFWNFPLTPKIYHEEYKPPASVEADEKRLAQIIKQFKPQGPKTIVDLGIGTGRELTWLNKLTGIKEIIGLDYSDSMLTYCKKELKKYKNRILLIKDDLRKLKVLPKIIKERNGTIIYLSLMNTFGNFTPPERRKTLSQVKQLMRPDDFLVLMLYKENQMSVARKNGLTNFYLKLLPKNKEDFLTLYRMIEYGKMPMFWEMAADKYFQPPKVIYRDRSIKVYLNKRTILISHRFTRQEIMEEFKEAGLKIAKLIEGKAMWIAVGRI